MSLPITDASLFDGNKISWSFISMDFIKGLPKSNQHLIILVVVDRFTNYAHFIPVSHPYSAMKIANLFSQHVI